MADLSMRTGVRETGAPSASTSGESRRPSALAAQADEALRRVIADRRPQSAPTPPPAGTPARTAFMRRMGW